MNIYQNCPIMENDKYVLRLISYCDLGDLLKVYSDIKSVPLFNSDNCHGDDFYYNTKERMEQALNFWKEAYINGWFVRFFTNCGLLRLDLRSDYEKSTEIESIMSIIARPSFDLFGCAIVATKAIPTATERIKALIKLGFTKSEEPLVGHDGTKYYDYYVLN